MTCRCLVKVQYFQDIVREIVPDSGFGHSEEASLAQAHVFTDGVAK